MTIGDRIKKLRKEKGISVDKLAEIIGKDRATIYRYESNDIEKMPTSVLEPLATALGTTPAYLMGWDDTPPTTEDTIFKLLKAQYKLNEQDVKFVMDYIKLTPAEREALRTAIEAIKKIKDAD